MAPLAITFALLDSGRSAGQVGDVLAVYAVTVAPLLLAGGMAAGRFGCRPTMVVGDLLGAAGQLTLACLVLAGHPALWEFMAAQAVQACGQALYGPAMTAVIPWLCGRSALPQANALIGIAASASAIAAPATAGLLTALIGPGWPILTDGLTFLISAACLSRMPKAPGEPVSQSVLQQLRSGWRTFCGTPWIWIVTGYDAAGSLLVFAPFLVVGAVIAKTSLGGPGAWGVIIAAEAAGAVVGGLISLVIHPRRPLVAAMTARFTMLAPLLLLIARAPVLAIMSGACLAGLGSALSQTFWGTTMQSRVPAPRLAQVSAFDQLGVTAAAPVGYILVGPLAAGLGVNGALLLAAAALAVLTTMVLSVPAIRAVNVHAQPPPNSRF